MRCIHTHKLITVSFHFMNNLYISNSVSSSNQRFLRWIFLGIQKRMVSLGLQCFKNEQKKTTLACRNVISLCFRLKAKTV